MCCNVASDCRNRMAWVELVAVWRFVRKLFDREHAIRVQVVGTSYGAFERPLRFIAPVAPDEDASVARLMSIAVPHDEKANRGHAIHAIVDTLKPVVEPTRSELVRIDSRRRAKLCFSGGCMCCSTMP